MFDEMCNKYALYSVITLYSILSVIVIYLYIRSQVISKYDVTPEVKDCNITVEIWGKASISLYLWEHILEGKTEIVSNGMGRKGQVFADNLLFNFRYGPIFIQTTVPSDVENLVLVLNGRSLEKIETAKQWLDYLPHYNKLKNVAIVLLGDEKCNNDWIIPYMKSVGGKIDVLFLIYDSLLVDNEVVYQWPLGVAQYRGFQNIPVESVNTTTKREYACNFVGTVYKNSSRSTLLQIINSVSATGKCPIIGRKEWKPSETEESLNNYIKVMENSDLTLCPVGFNTECYRIYEAMSVGSVPVVEDVTTPGNCNARPLRLLKQYNAPFIFVKDWKELHYILKIELALPQRVKRKRRLSILEWYFSFKKRLKEHFIEVINKKFCS